MDQTTLIETFQSHLETELSVPVRTKGGLGDERPVPVVILEDFDVQDLVFHNTHLAQVVEHDTAGVSDERYFRFHYEARLDYTVRAADDLSALQLRDDLRRALYDVCEEPQSLDGDLRRCALRGGGGFTHSFVEDTESEMTQAVLVRSFEQVSKSNYSTLDDIKESFNVT